jgi:hypothetical protein
LYLEIIVSNPLAAVRRAKLNERRRTDQSPTSAFCFPLVPSRTRLEVDCLIPALLFSPRTHTSLWLIRYGIVSFITKLLFVRVYNKRIQRIRSCISRSIELIRCSTLYKEQKDVR